MTKQQPSFLRKTDNVVVKAIVLFILFVFLLAVYAGLKERWAKRQVEVFSRSVVIGMPISDLENRAKELGLHYRGTDGNDLKGRFSVWQGFAFSRWFCEVEYEDGKAVQKRILFLD